MKFANWFKITWWIILLLLVGILMYQRVPTIVAGTAVSFDIFIFLVFVALVLVPVFSEVELFGIKLRREMDDLKTDVRIKLGDIKAEIKANQSQTLTATFNGLPSPPSDNKLDELETQINRDIKPKIRTHGENVEFDVPRSSLEMFKIRYNIEVQLRRIWENRFQESELTSLKGISIIKVLRELVQAEVIDANIQGLLQEIFAICNYAIHGKPVTERQIHFVNNNSREIVDYLAQIN